MSCQLCRCTSRARRSEGVSCNTAHGNMSDPGEELDYGYSDNSQARLSFSAGSAGLPSGASAGQEANAADQQAEEVLRWLGALHKPFSSCRRRAQARWSCRQRLLTAKLFAPTCFLLCLVPSDEGRVACKRTLLWRQSSVHAVLSWFVGWEVHAALSNLGGWRSRTAECILNSVSNANALQP